MEAGSAGDHVETSHRADIGAGTKRPPLAAQYHRSNARVLLQREGGLSKLLHHVWRQRIQAFRPSQHQMRDGAVPFNSYRHGIPFIKRDATYGRP